MWPVAGGVALVVVIAGAIVVTLRHDSTNQAQECSRDVYPYIEHSTIQGPSLASLPTTSTGIFQWEAGRVRQAAQKASSDPALAKDLNTIVTGLVMLGQANGNPGKYTTGGNQMNRGIKALSMLCPLAGGSTDPGPTALPRRSLPQPSASVSQPTGFQPQPSGSLSASQAAMCSAIKDALTPTNGSSLADNLRLMQEKSRQAARRASSDPALANELNAAATDMQHISATIASHGNPSSEDAQLADQEEAIDNTLGALCGPASG
jgi:hypothetical protein